VRIVTIAGSGTHRGLDRGRDEAGATAAAATALKTHLAATGRSPAALADRLATGPLPRVAADLVPDLWSEVTALASASRVSLSDVLLLCFLDEGWALARRGPALPPPGCSVLARVLPGRPGRTDIGGLDDDAVPPQPPTTEIAQTMDLPAWASGRAEVLRVGPDHGPTALVLAYPGTVGLCGSNEAGLAVAVNALTDAPFSPEGLGVAFITRQLLTLTTLAEAEAFLTAVPHAAGQAYTVAATDGLATFEADATGVRRVTAPGATRLAHTNHSLGGAAVAEPPPAESSAARLGLLSEALEHNAPLAVALAAVTVDGSRWGDRMTTFGAFRAVGSQPVARFIDGAGMVAGREWTKVGYH
jgi:hypothetical protein